MCKLCNGTHVVHTEPMPGMLLCQPCPQCNNAWRAKMGYEPYKEDEHVKS